MPRRADSSSHASDAAGQLLEFVRTRIVTDADVEIDASTPLFEEGLINSINILALIGYVEERLGRRLDDDEITMPHFRTVQTITDAFLS